MVAHDVLMQWVLSAHSPNSLRRAVAEGEDVRRLDARSRALPLKQMAQAWVTVSILRGPQALTKEWRDGISRILWPQEWPGLEDGQAPQP